MRVGAGTSGDATRKCSEAKTSKAGSFEVKQSFYVVRQLPSSLSDSLLGLIETCDQMKRHLEQNLKTFGESSGQS